jgi:sulfur carrier protein
MITIQVNGNTIEVKENTNISQLLKKTKTPTNGIAIAINSKIISKLKWDSQAFQNNDDILIITATQGG